MSKNLAMSKCLNVLSDFKYFKTLCVTKKKKTFSSIIVKIVNQTCDVSKKLPPDINEIKISNMQRKK